MDRKNLFAIMDDAMSVLTQADAWDEIEKNDPFIKQAREQFDDSMAEAEKVCGKALSSEIDTAIGAIMPAYSDAGIMYGIQIALAVREAALNPCEFSQYVLDRIAGKRGCVV